MWWAGLAQAGLGLAQTVTSAISMAGLPKRREFTVDPALKEVQGRYRKVADEGYSQAERSAFQQQLARQTGSSNRTMHNLGLASLGPSIANIFNVDALNKFSAGSAAASRQGLSGLANTASQIQASRDRETYAFNQELAQKRAALGGAMQAGTKNLVGGITGSAGAKFAQDQNAAYLQSLEGLYGNNTMSPVTTPPSGTVGSPLGAPMGFLPPSNSMGGSVGPAGGNVYNPLGQTNQMGALNWPY